MTLYKNINGDSGVYSYEIGTDYIDVKFKNTSKIYKYTYSSAGTENVEKMKQLAMQGHGLNSFININVKYLYEK